MKSVLLIVVNDPAFFVSHRLPIAVAAQENGYEVHVATSPGSSVSIILDHGFKYHELRITRSGKNIFSELVGFFSIWNLCCRLKPDILHLVTIKPVLYGGIAARIAPVKGVLAAISGLGFVFTAEGRKAGFLRTVIASMYRIALGKKNLKVVCQNPDDQRALTAIRAIDSDKSLIIRGSGVDLTQYIPYPEEDGVPVVTMAARLLKDKGVVEYIDAVSILKARGVKARFQLVGDVDNGNPTTITSAQLSAWAKEGLVSCLGYKADMASVFRSSHIVVLPSYREGLPRVLVEAAACGRAVITTDVPGCRDAIQENVTGLLVPVKNSHALADAIEKLVNDSEMRKSMGAKGRALAEATFAIDGIVSQHLDIYRSLEEGA